MIKQLRVNAIGTTYRTEEYLGRTWTVVPVVALVEGVVHAMNAAEPELVKAEAFTKYPDGWNGRPVFIGHPVVNGAPVSGNSPNILEALSVGQVFNAGLRDGKLVMEAWLDNSRADDVPELKAMLSRIKDGKPIEISVGAFVETNDATGEFRGATYHGEWVDLTPDHLALLPEGDLGACSRDMGCGVRAARRVKGADMTEKNQGLVARVMAAVRALVSPEEMSDTDVRQKIGEALQRVDPRAYYPDAVYADKGEFVYSVYADGGVKYYKRGYELSDDGKVTVAGDARECEMLVKYEEIGTSEIRAAAQDSCSCKKEAPKTASSTTTQEIINMNRDDIAQKLAGASDEQLANIAKVFEAPAAPAQQAAAPAQEAAPTFESLLAAASPEVREAFASNIRAAADRKATTIKMLKDSGRCTFADDALARMSQADLDALKTLAGVSSPVDFSAMGVARQPETAPQAAPAAPDLTARILARQGK